MSEAVNNPGADMQAIPEHYAYVTRSLMNLFQQGRLTNVSTVDVEPKYGYTSRITYTDGSHRVTYGNDLGLNPGASEDLAKDKGHTKFLLRTIGVECPRGEEFLLPWWAETIGENQRKRGNEAMLVAGMAPEYIDTHLGYPVYVKPVAGSKGIGVRKVCTGDELEECIEELNEQRSRVMVVEEAVQMPDYRIVALDGQLISAYERVPLGVVGNGTLTIKQLLMDLQTQFEEDGRDTILTIGDPRHIAQLARQGLHLETVLPFGKTVTIADISNLSAGGSSVDVTERIAQEWVDLAAYVADNFNLRLLGLDLACEDITDGTSPYSVLEVNSTPGLDHYASSGEAQKIIVDDLYTAVLNAFPHK